MNDLARMTELAQALGSGALRAYTEPAMAVANRPCLLVLPPAEDAGAGAAGGAHGFDWQFALLSSHPAGTYEAVAELAPLVELVRPLIDFDTRRYAPMSLPTSTGPVLVPACLFTYFEIA